MSEGNGRTFDPDGTFNPDEVCGEPTADGGICQRQAGLGTDRDSGPCYDHTEDYHNPNRLDETVITHLCTAAEAGAFKKHCAYVSGISPRTLRKWLEWGEADAESGVDSPCGDLFVRFQRARAAGALRRLKDADTEFVLERSYGYTKTEKRELEHSGGIDTSGIIEAMREAGEMEDAEGDE